MLQRETVQPGPSVTTASLPPAGPSAGLHFASHSPAPTKALLPAAGMQSWLISRFCGSQVDTMTQVDPGSKQNALITLLVLSEFVGEAACPWVLHARPGAALGFPSCPCAHQVAVRCWRPASSIKWKKLSCLDSAAGMCLTQGSAKAQQVHWSTEVFPQPFLPETLLWKEMFLGHR